SDSAVKPLAIVRDVLGGTLRRLWPLAALLALTTIGAMAAELAPPLLLRRILDEHLGAGLAQGLMRLAIFYVGALLLASTLGFAQTMMTTYIGQNALFSLRLRMAAHLARLPMRYHNTTPVGETMSRLTADVEAVDALFSAGLINAATDLLKIAGIVAAMYAISPLLCGVALAVTPVVFVLAEFFRRRTFGAQVGVRRSVGEINTFLQETFAGVRTLKAYGQEEWIKDRFQIPLASNLKAENHAAVYVAYLPCVMQLVRAITIALVVWLGGRMGVTARLGVTVGGLAAMADLIGRLFGPVEALSQEFQTVQQAMAGLWRIAELLGMPPEDRGQAQGIERLPAPDPAHPFVTVQGLSFDYNPGAPVLRDVSLAVRPGRKVAIVGRTGAGKTTLINLIAGLYRPEAGQIAIAGYAPHRLDPSDRRRLIGIVPQNVQLFEGTVLENITLRDETIPLEAVIGAAQTVGLHEAIEALPDGYGSRLGEGNGSLSYGQTQLLALARAIVTDPPLLLLDEPTSGLDAVTERAVYDAFRAAGRSRTILTISHRLSGVIDADQVHIMANGQIVQSGAPGELAGQRGWYSVFKQLEDLGWQTTA
ncbi:MAG: ABC transporter ATP-binding protein, partial [Chloroflexi bacterium]|nr:ABC transporter ATP-binding protein [Chloroflexota bacterium]